MLLSIRQQLLCLPHIWVILSIDHERFSVQLAQYWYLDICRVNLLVNLNSLSQMIIRTFSGEYAAIIIIIVSIERTCLMWCFQRQLLCRASLSHRNIVTKGFWHHVSSFKLAWRKKIGNRDFSNANTFFKGYIKGYIGLSINWAIRPMRLKGLREENLLWYSFHNKQKMPVCGAVLFKLRW